ncbi:MAG: hypothetical protein ACRC2K_03025 [Clostridium sp.]
MGMLVNGLILRSEALNLELQGGRISNISGSIKSKENVVELYEASILECKISNSPVFFKDMVLNVLKGEISINIIGVDFESNGVFIKYSHNFYMNLKSFNELNIKKILFVDGDFKVTLNGEIYFNLVSFIPFENKRDLENPSIIKEKLLDGDYFDKEFI